MQPGGQLDPSPFTSPPCKPGSLSDFVALSQVQIMMKACLWVQRQLDASPLASLSGKQGSGSVFKALSPGLLQAHPIIEAWMWVQRQLDPSPFASLSGKQGSGSDFNALSQAFCSGPLSSSDLQSLHASGILGPLPSLPGPIPSGDLEKLLVRPSPSCSSVSACLLMLGATGLINAMLHTILQMLQSEMDPSSLLERGSHFRGVSKCACPPDRPHLLLAGLRMR